MGGLKSIGGRGANNARIDGGSACATADDMKLRTHAAILVRAVLAWHWNGGQLPRKGKGGRGRWGELGKRLKEGLWDDGAIMRTDERLVNE